MMWAAGVALASSTQSPAAASPAIPTDRITYPAYEQVRGLDDYASPVDYARAVADRRFVTERIAYTSDGLSVRAYLYRPASPRGRLPVIIFNRGSWTRESFHAEMLPLANRMAASGFLVVAPMYRGSGGAPGRDEMGGADLNDLFNLLPVLRQLPYADIDRLYLYGESRGGMMVYQALRDGFPARAAAVYGAFTDLGILLANPQWAGAAAQIWPEFEAQSEAIVERRSAARWAARISTPVLIMHGGRDTTIDVGHALVMAERLHRHGRPFELVVMAGEGHVLTGRAADRDRSAAEWFRRHAPTASAVRR